MLRFQSTFPRGERLWHIRDYRHIMLFQSTFPRGERRLLPERRDAMLGNFNPRSLVGNDVSVQRNLYRGFNFNPRSLVGNDAALYTLVPYCADFNPRSLVGNDQSPRSCRRCPRYFNPRSLVGNDRVRIIQDYIFVIFQSTFPRGERPYLALILHRLRIFQSTFPRGERRVKGKTLSFDRNFNPRSLVGNDTGYRQR